MYIANGGKIYLNNALILFINNAIEISKINEKLQEGESWLSMRERTKYQREDIYQRAVDMASFIANALNDRFEK